MAKITRIASIFFMLMDINKPLRQVSLKKEEEKFPSHWRYSLRREFALREQILSVKGAPPPSHIHTKQEIQAEGKKYTVPRYYSEKRCFHCQHGGHAMEVKYL